MHEWSKLGGFFDRDRQTWGKSKEKKIDFF